MEVLLYISGMGYREQMNTSRVQVSRLNPQARDGILGDIAAGGDSDNEVKQKHRAREFPGPM